MAKNKIENLKVGHYYEQEFVVTEEIGLEFAKISKDFNPIHIDEEVAAKTRFKKRIVHGMLLGSYISGIIGNEFPGDGTVYMGQNLSFRSPIYYDKKVIVRIEITERDLEKKRLKLSTTCRNENGDMLIIGDALVMLDA